MLPLTSAIKITGKGLADDIVNSLSLLISFLSFDNANFLMGILDDEEFDRDPVSVLVAARGGAKRRLCLSREWFS
jgi:hypothetical protein